MHKSISVQEWIQFYKLARARHNSRKDYQQFQYFQGTILVRYLKDYNVALVNKQALDLGSGIGGYSKALQEAGSTVIACDRYYRPYEYHGSIIFTDALYTPFEDKSLDIVVCASLIEHIENQEGLISEIVRVLRDEGYLYLSFPPYYSILGGHQFAPYHLLGEKFATMVALKRGVFTKEQLGECNGSDIFRKIYGAWGLIPLSISKVSKILEKYPLKLINRSTRWLPIDFSWLPYLGEFLTWHVQFLLQKL